MSNYYSGLSAPVPQAEFLKRKKFLEKTVVLLEERLAEAPDGSLVVARHAKSGAAGFYRVAHGGSERTYLNQTHGQTIRQLAQKEYDRKALKTARKELTALNAVLNYCTVDKVEDVLDRCQKDKQPYIAPVVESDEGYRQKWLSQKYYQKRAQDGEKLYPTEKGDLVRSKSESIQADYLYHHGYDYLYEKRVTLYDQGQKTYRYPDFTILDPVTRQEVIYEHFGMLDDPDYLRNSLKKLKLYLENGYVIGETLLITCETYEQPFTTDQLARVLKARFGH